MSRLLRSSLLGFICTTNEKAETGRRGTPVLETILYPGSQQDGLHGRISTPYGPPQKFSSVFRLLCAGHWRADCPAARASPILSAAGPAPVRLRHDGGWLGRRGGHRQT